jgi:hypothetical protein
VPRARSRRRFCRWLDEHWELPHREYLQAQLHLYKLREHKAKLTTKIGFWQNEPNLRDPIAELGE